MPSNARVFIHYGPYDSCGVVEYSTHRLDGIKDVLKCDGHQFELIKINDRNAVELYVNGEQVFVADIRDLEFGGDGKLDPLCTSALQKVKEAF